MDWVGAIILKYHPDFSKAADFRFFFYYYYYFFILWFHKITCDVLLNMEALCRSFMGGRRNDAEHIYQSLMKKILIHWKLLSLKHTLSDISFHKYTTSAISKKKKNLISFDSDHMFNHELEIVKYKLSARESSLQRHYTQCHFTLFTEYESLMDCKKWVFSRWHLQRTRLTFRNIPCLNFKTLSVLNSSIVGVIS